MKSSWQNSRSSRDSMTYLRNNYHMTERNNIPRCLRYSCSSYSTYLESSDPPALSLALVLTSHCTVLPSKGVNSERTNYSCHSLALACSVSPSFSRVWNDSNMALTPLNLALAYFLRRKKLEHNNPQIYIKEGWNMFPHRCPSSKL